MAQSPVPAEETPKSPDHMTDEQPVFTADTKFCASCMRIATKKCVRCHVTHYCSKTCQTRHWKEHKQDCTKRKKIYDQSVKEGTEIMALPEMDRPCFMPSCTTPALKTNMIHCEVCRFATYCSTEHKKQHKKAHKKMCAKTLQLAHSGRMKLLEDMQRKAEEPTPVPAASAAATTGESATVAASITGEKAATETKVQPDEPVDTKAAAAPLESVHVVHVTKIPYDTLQGLAERARKHHLYLQISKHYQSVSSRKDAIGAIVDIMKAFEVELKPLNRLYVLEFISNWPELSKRLSLDLVDMPALAFFLGPFVATNLSDVKFDKIPPVELSTTDVKDDAAFTERIIKYAKTTPLYMRVMNSDPREAEQRHMNVNATLMQNVLSTYLQNKLCKTSIVRTFMFMSSEMAHSMTMAEKFAVVYSGTAADNMIFALAEQFKQRQNTPLYKKTLQFFIATKLQAQIGPSLVEILIGHKHILGMTANIAECLLFDQELKETSDYNVAASLYAQLTHNNMLHHALEQQAQKVAFDKFVPVEPLQLPTTFDFTPEVSISPDKYFYQSQQVKGWERERKTFAELYHKGALSLIEEISKAVNKIGTMSELTATTKTRYLHMLTFVMSREFLDYPVIDLAATLSLWDKFSI